MDSKRGSKLHSIIEKLSEQCVRVDNNQLERQESNINKQQITVVNLQTPKKRKGKPKSAKTKLRKNEVKTTKRKSSKTVDSSTQTYKVSDISSCQPVDDDLCINVNALVCITPQVKDIEAEHNYVDRSLSEHACRLCFNVSTSRAEFLKHCKTSHPALFEEQSSSESELEEEDIESVSDEYDSDYDPNSDSEVINIIKSADNRSAKRWSARLRSKKPDERNESEENKEQADSSGAAVNGGDGEKLPEKLPTLSAIDNYEFIKDYECELCNEEFYFEIQLADHMAKTHPGSDNEDNSSVDKGKPTLPTKRKYDCEHCDKRFKTRSDLLLHLNTVVQKLEGKNPKTEYNFRCNECFRKFKTEQGQEHHIKDNFTEEPLSCDNCGKLFQYNCSLKRHKRRPCVVKKKKRHETECDVCGKQFRRRDYLLRHMRIHTGVKKYQCEYCGKSFTHQGTLKTHVMLHTGERPFKCKQCDASFVNRTSLRDHENRHTGFMPYPCTMCSKRFLKSNHLKTHILSHSTEKPFSCKVCGKGFKRRDHLRTHVIIHSDKKPYKCDTCGRTFNQRICLTKHLPCKELERHPKKSNKSQEVKPKRSSEKSSKKDMASSQSANINKSSAANKKKTKKSKTQNQNQEDSTGNEMENPMNYSEGKEDHNKQSPSLEIQINERKDNDKTENEGSKLSETTSMDVDTSNNQLDPVSLNSSTTKSILHTSSVKVSDCSTNDSLHVNEAPPITSTASESINFDKLDFASGFPSTEPSIQASTMSTFNLANQRLLDSCVYKYSSMIPQTFVPFNCENTDTVYESGSLELDSLPVGSHDNMLGNQTFHHESGSDLGSALLAAIDPEHLNPMANTTTFFPPP